MRVKILNISLPLELVKVLDEQAKLHYATRSEYIKTTLINRLKSDGILNESMTFTPQNYEEARKARLKEYLRSIGYE